MTRHQPWRPATQEEGNVLIQNHNVKLKLWYVFRSGIFLSFCQIEFMIWQRATASNQKSERQRETWPTNSILNDNTSPSSSPTKTPPPKRARTQSRFKPFHLNGSNASPRSVALDDALRAQTHASPHEVRSILCEFEILPSHHLINDGPLLQSTSLHHMWMFWSIKLNLHNHSTNFLPLWTGSPHMLVTLSLT